MQNANAAGQPQLATPQPDPNAGAQFGTMDATNVSSQVFHASELLLTSYRGPMTTACRSTMTSATPISLRISTSSNSFRVTLSASTRALSTTEQVSKLEESVTRDSLGAIDSNFHLVCSRHPYRHHPTPARICQTGPRHLKLGSFSIIRVPLGNIDIQETHVSRNILSATGARHRYMPFESSHTPPLQNR